MGDQKLCAVPGKKVVGLKAVVILRIPPQM
jgi:hypothetical protein